MKIREILLNPSRSLDYMERLVNNGSASGFSSIHTSSKETNPFHSEEFHVKVLTPNNQECISSYGVLPDICRAVDENDSIFFHPDWKITSDSEYGQVSDSYYVIPTSSVRTVRIKDSNYYLKLCYPGKLGRIERELKYPHLISGIEITGYLDHLLQSGKANKYFGFMPEIGGKLFNSKINLGYIVRKLNDIDAQGLLVPAFSLFSIDKNSVSDEPILSQILDLKGNSIEYFLSQIAIPLIDMFFDCAFYEGLIPEMHSQNIVYLFDNSFELKKILLRDLESIDKDVTIRKHLRLSNFLSFPHKCIDDTNEYYLMRHSFMYDHKLCEYLLDPLVQLVSEKTMIDGATIKSSIKQYANKRLLEWKFPFFPKDGNWYKYPNIEIDRSTSKRPFIAIPNPNYR